MVLNSKYVDDPSGLFKSDWSTGSSNSNELQQTQESFQVNALIDSFNLIQLKKSIRYKEWSLDHPIRECLWRRLAGLHAGRKYSERSTPELLDKSPPSTPKKLPAFIDVTYCRFFHLNEEGQKSVEKVIWSLAREHPEVAFCPLVYPLTALFLHFMTDKEALISISLLIQANTPINMTKSNSSDFKSHNDPNSEKKYAMTRSLLPKSKTQISKDAYVLIKLSNSFSVSFWPQRGIIRKQRENLSKRNDIDPALQEWLKWIFIGLPFPHLVRIVDCFLVEGFKFLIRIGLTLLLLLKRSADTDQDSLTLDQMISFCENISLSPNQLIHLACSLSRITSNKIVKQYKKADDVVRSHPGMTGMTPMPSPAALRRGDMMRNVDVQITSRVAPRSINSKIIDWYHLDQLWEWIPDRISIKEPSIAFTIDEDGCSLRRFFSKTESLEPTILLIKTSVGEVFGAYCSESWSNRLGRESGTFFGNGETFLFSLKPKVQKYSWTDIVSSTPASPTSAGQKSRKLARAIHSSQLFMTATQNHIIIGSGNGSGIWLDEDLGRGKSERCDTFNNEPLSAAGDFTCIALEVIAFN